MPPRNKLKKFEQLTEFEQGRTFLSCNNSSCAAEPFHSGARLEELDRRATNHSKYCKWTTECDVRALRSTPTPHGGE